MTDPQTLPPQTPAQVAPVWHTAVLVLLLLGVSSLNALARPHVGVLHVSRIPTYLLTLAWEWFLLAFIYGGLRMRRTPLRRLLGVRRPGAAEWWTDVGIAGGFWFASALTLAACAVLLRLTHLDPGSIRNAMLRMAPASVTELAVWIALSITAGFCEELIFRGYLQQQCIALTRNVWLGAAISALIFGLAHAYQGVSGVLLITLYGVLFSVLAQQRGSLRAGIFAHAWQDSFIGIVLFISVHILHRLPH